MKEIFSSHFALFSSLKPFCLAPPLIKESEASILRFHCLLFINPFQYYKKEDCHGNLDGRLSRNLCLLQPGPKHKKAKDLLQPVSGLSLLGQGSKKVPKVSCEAVFWKWQDFSIDSVTWKFFFFFNEKSNDPLMVKSF